jgi:hypothetical protein
MVAYTDVPAANALVEEQAKINQGIALVDAGGKISSFTIIPPLPDPGSPPGVPMMSATLSAVDPSLSFMQSVRDAMVARSAEIDDELAALGVDPAPPPDPPASDSGTRSISATGIIGAFKP